MRTLELQADAPVAPGLTDRPGFKELLIEDLSDVIEAKTPSTFTLNNTVQILLTHCDYFLIATKSSNCLKTVATRSRRG